MRMCIPFDDNNHRPVVVHPLLMLLLLLCLWPIVSRTTTAMHEQPSSPLSLPKWRTLERKDSFCNCDNNKALSNNNKEGKPLTQSEKRTLFNSHRSVCIRYANLIICLILLEPTDATASMVNERRHNRTNQ